MRGRLSAFLREHKGHLGRLGQKEIARSYPDCFRALVASGGAGLVAAGMVLGKLLIYRLPGSTPVAWVAHAFLISLNFVASFLFMQLCRFRLATKMSPMIGAAMGAAAAAARGCETKGRRLRETAFWGLGTQLAGAVGNLVILMPAVFVLHALILSWNGEAFMSPQAAEAALLSLHPWKSGTLLYAVFTGGLLWFCALSAAAVGKRFWPSSKLATGVCFNVGIGVMLGLIPLYGKLLGLPLDVRHFTVTSGTMGMALASLGLRKALDAGLLAACAGALGVGFLNVTVSFALGFATTRMADPA